MAGQVVQLELVRRDDVGGRHGVVAHELRDAGAHEDAAADIADDGIAAIERLRVRLPHPRHRRQDRVADIGRAHIAGRARRRSGAARPARRCPPRSPRSPARRRPGPSRRRSRCGSRTARYGSARPRHRAAASGTRPRRCRHGRRRHGTGWRGCSCDRSGSCAIAGVTAKAAADRKPTKPVERLPIERAADMRRRTGNCGCSTASVDTVVAFVRENQACPSRLRGALPSVSLAFLSILAPATVILTALGALIGAGGTRASGRSWLAAASAASGRRGLLPDRAAARVRGLAGLAAEASARARRQGRALLPALRRAGESSSPVSSGRRPPRPAGRRHRRDAERPLPSANVARPSSGASCARAGSGAVELSRAVRAASATPSPYRRALPHRLPGRSARRRSLARSTLAFCQLRVEQLQHVHDALHALRWTMPSRE